jgi:CDP-diacylglycerol--glycerol-3-phosphate 3-phosphatidyltransferase
VRGLYALKPWYTRQLSSVVRTAETRQLSPDVFTAAGVLAAAAAAVALWQGWAVLAALLLGARLAGANLDGAVARARAVSRPWGFVLNELGDRTSDLLMFAGLVALGYRTAGADDRLVVVGAVLVAALAATLPTFAALSAAGAGAPRRNGGPLGKTERCALAVVACAQPSWLVGVCAVVLLGSLVTAGLRFRAAAVELGSAVREPIS